MNFEVLVQVEKLNQNEVETRLKENEIHTGITAEAAAFAAATRENIIKTKVKPRVAANETVPAAAAACMFIPCHLNFILVLPVGSNHRQAIGC